MAISVSVCLDNITPDSSPLFLTNIRSPPLDRDLTTRKETRQKAWEVDGWAETVSKVRGT